MFRTPYLSVLIRTYPYCFALTMRSAPGMPSIARSAAEGALLRRPRSALRSTWRTADTAGGAVGHVGLVGPVGQGLVLPVLPVLPVLLVLLVLPGFALTMRSAPDMPSIARSAAEGAPLRRPRSARPTVPPTVLISHLSSLISFFRVPRKKCFSACICIRVSLFIRG